MPYTDLKKQREAQARWYREKYQTDKKFRRAEAARKSDWLQTEEGRTSNAAASERFRLRQIAAEKKKAKSRAKTQAKAKPTAKTRTKTKTKAKSKAR
jgi:hypothetical protein